jgi:hypothetical protein
VAIGAPLWARQLARSTATGDDGEDNNDDDDEEEDRAGPMP